MHCVTSILIFRDVKFALVDKQCSFWFVPIYTDVCQHCILSTYQSSVKKIHRLITRVGFEPTTFASLEQCLTN